MFLDPALRDPWPSRSYGEWQRSTRPPAEYDTECYPDWWLFKVWLPDGRMYSLERTATTPLNREALQWFIDNFTLYSFNGDNYDEPMVTLAMSGATNWELKRANDHIIVGGLKRWHFYSTYGLEGKRLRNFDHVDVMEVAPGVRVGLKTYMGRAHCEKLQDLPYKPDEPTTPDMRVNLDVYCGNDLDGTRTLRTICQERLALRETMGEQYGVDLRSKSDAQMAEAIIKAKLGFIPEKRIVPHGWQFRYTPPAYIKFASHHLREALRIICDADFTVNDVDQLRSQPGEEIFDSDGTKIKTGIIMPLELKDLRVKIGETMYKLGIGGLHSMESAVQYHTIPGVQEVREDDVTSYYPTLILNLEITPAQLGPRFQEIYREIYDNRLNAKAKVGAKVFSETVNGLTVDFVVTADGLKIVLNGTFGKLGSKYSIMFAPELLIKVTITGQLSLFMLIESLHRNGIRVVSANTDGIVTVCPAGREWLRDGCIKLWELTTGLNMEASVIRSLYSRDVNNYLSIKMDGKHKGKGIFAESGVLMNVHPTQDIVKDSVIAYLKGNTPLDHTIRACQDIRQFLIIRGVKGGGCYREWMLNETTGAFDWYPVYLGKTVRWYYAAGEQRNIEYAKGGNKVAGSTGARPCMQLPATLPTDIDYDRYHAEAVKMLKSLGIDYAA